VREFADISGYADVRESADMKSRERIERQA